MVKPIYFKYFSYSSIDKFIFRYLKHLLINIYF